jgi:hypothetical protein
MFAVFGIVKLARTEELKAATERVKKKMSGCKLLTGMAGYTGQSSQLFPVATGRNAQFLATVERRLISKSF